MIFFRIQLSHGDTQASIKMDRFFDDILLPEARNLNINVLPTCEVKLHQEHIIPFFVIRHLIRS